MPGCNNCGASQLHSCGCKPKLDIWTRPQSMGRDKTTDCQPQSNSDCSPCNDKLNPTCAYNWSITPIQAASGGIVTFSGMNFPPNLHFNVKVVGPQADYYWPITSDSTGTVLATMAIGLLAGSYQFTPEVANCTGRPKRNSITVVASGPIDNSGPCSCLGTVSISPTIVNPTIYSGTKIAVVLIVRNTNSCPATDVTLPAIVLPDGLTSSVPLALTGISVPPNSSRTFTYELNAINASDADKQVALIVPPSSATYKCGGVSFFAGGGSSYGSIKSTVTGNCALAISQFSVTPAAITVGATVSYTLKVKNTGTNKIVNLNMASLSLASSIVTITPVANLAISNINLDAGAEHTVTIGGVVTAPSLTAGQQHAHQVLINAGTIIGTCNFGQISNMLPAATTLIVNS
jgi:hypothetical protein